MDRESILAIIDVLNGIAYEADKDLLIVTGKLRPELFEIKIQLKSVKVHGFRSQHRKLPWLFFIEIYGKDHRKLLKIEIRNLILEFSDILRVLGSKTSFLINYQ